MIKSEHLSIASETHFVPSAFSAALTAFAQGYKDSEDLGNLLEFIAPTVHTPRRFEFRKADHSDAFAMENDDIRAAGSSFKYVSFAGSLVQAKTLNKGLSIRVDYDDAFGENWQEHYVQMLLQRLLRNELVRVVALLKAHAVHTEKTWNETSNPDGDLYQLLKSSAEANGFPANRLLLGETAWFLRSESYEKQNNTRAAAAALLTPGTLAQKLFVDEIRLLKARYSVDEQRLPVLSNEVYAFYAKEGLLKDEVSHLKRFVTLTESGSPFRVYVVEHNKYCDISVEHYSNLALTSPQGIVKLTIKAD